MKSFFLAVLVGLLLLQVGAALPAQPDMEPQVLSIEVLPDPLGQLSATQVLSGNYEHSFTPYTEPAAAGFGPAIWLRLPLPPDLRPGEHVLEFRSPFINRFTIYAPDGHGGFAVSQAGNMVQASPNVLSFQYPALVIDLGPDMAPHAIYARLETKTTRYVTAALWSRNGFGEYRQARYLGQGFFFGGLILIGLIFIAFGFVARDSTYLVYAMYVLASAVIHWIAQGLAAPWLGVGYYNPVVGVGLCLALGLNAEVLRIARPDLHWPVLIRRYRKLCWGLAALLLPLALLGQFDVVSPVTQLLFVAQVAFGCIVSAWLWRKGEPGARLFFLAFLLLHISVCFFVLQNLGYITDSMWARDGMRLSVYAHFLVMSVAVAQRVRVLRDEKDAAQAALLSSMKHAEQVLETRVARRTQALEAEMQRRVAVEHALHNAHARSERALLVEREARQSQRDFFLMVSHDFRTPLSVLGATLHLIKPGVDPTRHARMLRALDELNGLMDNSLNADALGEMAPQFAVEDLDLNALIDDMIRRTEQHANQQRIRAALAPDCALRGDAMWLRILLSNLLHNAVHHTPPGTTVWVSTAVEDQKVRIAIEDNGPGIATEAMHRLGKRARRLSNAAAAGSGIGLYVSVEIVHRHDGEIEFSRGRHGGLRVDIVLPAIQAYGDCPVPMENRHAG